MFMQKMELYRDNGQWVTFLFSAHPSCMDYSAELAMRAKNTHWQCIDCKTCCICFDPGEAVSTTLSLLWLSLKTSRTLLPYKTWFCPFFCLQEPIYKVLVIFLLFGN